MAQVTNTKSELWFIRLELENWRQYLGKHHINFSTSSKKHLTVVHAENSVGKTTMLNAIKWCLYGETPEFNNKKILVSDRSEKNTCRVRLKFYYGEDEYTALRVYDQKYGRSKLTLNRIDKVSRAQLPENSPDAVINNILPSELSNYFLFAGERYSKALGDGNDMSHRRAIRDILGFTLSESVIDDIEYLEKKYNKKLTDLLKKDKTTEALGNELSKLEGYADDYKELGLTLKKSLEEQQKIKKENDNKIISSSHAKAQELGREQTKKDDLLARSRKHLTRALINKQKLVSKFGYILFGSKLTKENFDHIKINHAEIPSPYAENVVNKLINDQRCICGRSVLPNSSELKALEKVRDGATTKIMQKRVLNAISQGEYFIKMSKNFLTELKGIEEDLQSHNTEIGELEKKLALLKIEIGAIGDVDISEFQKLRDAAVAEIPKILRKQGELKSNIRTNNERITELKTQIRRSTVNSTEKDNLDFFVEISSKIIDRLKKTLKVNEASSLEAIKELVQKNIDQSLRKEKDVVLTQDYKFELQDRRTGLIDYGSDGGNGQTLLSNLSFISALISRSKDRAKSSDKSIFVPGTIAPFVIDAPFAEMDSSYRLNTFKFLPSQSHQLILFLSTGQWDEDYEKIIGKYIGKRYILVNHDMSNNFSENELIINGKTYQLNIQSDNNKSSATSIEEISWQE